MAKSTKKETSKAKVAADENKEAAKTVIKTVKKKEPYIGVNVRDKNGEIIGVIPSGNEVKVLENFNKSKERILIEGTTKKGKLIEGTVLTDMLE